MARVQLFGTSVLINRNMTDRDGYVDHSRKVCAQRMGTELFKEGAITFVEKEDPATGTIELRGRLEVLLP